MSCGVSCGVSWSRLGKWPGAIALAAAILVGCSGAEVSATPLTPFRYEAQAQRHCPHDRVVWLDFSKGVYYGKKQKQVVVGLRQRKGPLRFIHTKDAKANTLKAIIEEHIGEEVQYIMTDESSASWGALLNNPKHKVIRHNIGKYVEGIVHTNSIESAFSLLKRGIIGSFHRISIKHLHRYLAEFQYRFNARNDADRFECMVRRLLQTDTMQYKQLIADPVSTQ